jgi:hypothetical protein
MDEGQTRCYNLCTMSSYHEQPKKLITEELKGEIERIIRKIEVEYRDNQGLILTEDDIKCLLFQELQILFRFGNQVHYRQYQQNVQQRLRDLPPWRCPTIDDGIYASPVHAEIAWFDEREKLTIRPDITILEPQHLSITHGLNGVRLPSKQFVFGGQGIIFEIKFCRYKGGISRKFFDGIQNDFDKIERLFTIFRGQGTNDSLFCYYVVFNKTNNRCQEFNDFLNENREGSNYKLEYCTGLVRFNNRSGSG